jgi:hypothetical protein
VDVIQTERLLLEPLDGSRLEEFIVLTADPDTMRYWDPRGPYGRDAAERNFAASLARLREHASADAGSSRKRTLPGSASPRRSTSAKAATRSRLTRSRSAGCSRRGLGSGLRDRGGTRSPCRAHPAHLAHLIPISFNRSRTRPARNAPSGIRTRATALKGPRPGPLVDGGEGKPE